MFRSFGLRVAALMAATGLLSACVTTPMGSGNCPDYPRTLAEAGLVEIDVALKDLDLVDARLGAGYTRQYQEELSAFNDKILFELQNQVTQCTRVERACFTSPSPDCPSYRADELRTSDAVQSYRKAWIASRLRAKEAAEAAQDGRSEIEIRRILDGLSQLLRNPGEQDVSSRPSNPGFILEDASEIVLGINRREGDPLGEPIEYLNPFYSLAGLNKRVPQVVDQRFFVDSRDRLLLFVEFAPLSTSDE
ncbi:MAG: hypothetical protein AAF224_09420 [Pseudomonadota bacterium]